MADTRMTLLELADRCEKATGPDRELEGEIAEVHGWFKISLRDSRGALGMRPGSKSNMLEWVPHYTTSLNAAMTLAVEGVSAPDVLRHAIEQCTRYGEPMFIEALPRFVAAQWLRARAQ